jgi:hypothetical protein
VSCVHAFDSFGATLELAVNDDVIVAWFVGRVLAVHPLINVNHFCRLATTIPAGPGLGFVS